MQYTESVMNFQIFKLHSLKILLKLFYRLLHNKSNLKQSSRSFVKSLEIQVHQRKKLSGVTVLKS
jgi:hypothetical protein